MLEANQARYASGTLALLLSTHAASAVPVGLASAISAAVITSSTSAAAPIAATSFIIMSKIKVISLTALIVTGAAVPWMWQQAKLNRAEKQIAALTEQAKDANDLRQELELLQQKLSQKQAAESLTSAQLAELLRLRGEIGPLRKESKELARSRAAADSNALSDALPASAWANLGLARPEAAMQTFFWAGKHGETNLVSNLLRWRRDPRIPASSDLDLNFAQGMVSGAALLGSTTGAFRILTQEEDGDESIMAVEITDQNGKTGAHKFRFIREEEHWFPVMHVWLQDQQNVRASVEVPSKWSQPAN
jgi:hypothetical protein